MELFNPNEMLNKALSDEVKCFAITNDFFQIENHLNQRIRNFGNTVNQLKVLEKLYQQVISKIVEDNIEKKYEAKTTGHETLFRKHLDIQSKIRKNYSMWIKNFNVDIFFPRYRIVVEIDGGIHNHELKMKKDTYRDEYLKKKYGVLVFHVDNEDLQRTIGQFISFLKTTKPIPLNDYRKLMRLIYVDTISCHLTKSEITKMLEAISSLKVASSRGVK